MLFRFLYIGQTTGVHTCMWFLNFLKKSIKQANFDGATVNLVTAVVTQSSKCGCVIPADKNKHAQAIFTSHLILYRTN